MYDFLIFLCIQTKVFNFEIKLNKILKYKLIFNAYVQHMEFLFLCRSILLFNISNDDR
jgi:hypothetical protein